MKFKYQARNEKGEVFAGEIEASSQEIAAEILRNQGLFLTYLEPKGKSLFDIEFSFLDKPKQKDLVMFSRQLSIMFKSKMPLIEALRTLGQETKKRSFKKVILQIANLVEGGIPFSKALSQYPDLFTPFYIAMVRSGEASGKLSEILEYLANHLEKEYHLKSRVKGAMIYPSVIILTAIGVVSLLMMFVIPPLVNIMKESGQALPLPTQIVIAVSNFMRKWWWLLFGGAIGLFLGIKFYYKTKQGKTVIDAFLLKLPVLGKFLKTLYITRFAENFATLTASGLSIVRSLEITADVVGNESYRQALLKVKDRVSKGDMVSKTLRNFPDLFPAIFTQMILVGERTGTLDEVLTDIAEFYQKEIDRTIANLLSILEPVMIVFLGGVVALIVLSVLMPIYQSMSAF